MEVTMNIYCKALLGGTVALLSWFPIPSANSQSGGLAKQVKDINTTLTAAPSRPGGFVRMGGLTYFHANDGGNGDELWVTDGTVAGTQLLKDIYVGSGSSYPTSLTDVNGVLYFMADDLFNGPE